VGPSSKPRPKSRPTRRSSPSSLSSNEDLGASVFDALVAMSVGVAVLWGGWKAIISLGRIADALDRAYPAQMETP